MANEEHLGLIKQGVDTWNRWRDEHPDAQPDLSDADLHGTNLIEADLRGANLSWGNLNKANLSGAKLYEANLHPILDGMEAILWFGVALIFENDITNLVRRCQLKLDDGEWELDGDKRCGKFFIYTSEQRKYCATPGHAEQGKKQSVLKAIRAWQRGEGPRMGSRKKSTKRKRK
jgi:hypothetical protein